MSSAVVVGPAGPVQQDDLEEETVVEDFVHSPIAHVDDVNRAGPRSVKRLRESEDEPLEEELRCEDVSEHEAEHGTAAGGIVVNEDGFITAPVSNKLSVAQILQMGTTRRQSDDFLNDDLPCDPNTLEWLPGAVLYSWRAVEGANAAVMMMACAPSTPERISVVRPMRLPAGLNRATFLVDLSTLKHWKDVLVDDYGSWGVQSGGAAQHFYVDVVQLTAKNVSNRKVGAPNSLYNWLLRPVYTTHPCSMGRFKRRIFLGRPADLAEWRWSVLCYEWIGDGHPNDMQLRPHGNARKNLQPYQPTQASTREALREIATRRRPTVAFVEAHMRLAEEGADGCFAAESPRNLVQIQNYRRASRPTGHRRSKAGPRYSDEDLMQHMEGAGAALADSMLNNDPDDYGYDGDPEVDRMARRWHRRTGRTDQRDATLATRLNALPTLTEIFGSDEDEMYARALAISLRRMTPANRHWIKVQFRKLISEVTLAEQGVDPSHVDVHTTSQQAAAQHGEHEQDHDSVPGTAEAHAEEPILAPSPELLAEQTETSGEGTSQQQQQLAPDEHLTTPTESIGSKGAPCEQIDQADLLEQKIETSARSTKLTDAESVGPAIKRSKRLMEKSR